MQVLLHMNEANVGPCVKVTSSLPLITQTEMMQDVHSFPPSAPRTL